MFGDIEIEKKKLYHHKIPFLKKLVEKTVNTLLGTCVMIIKLPLHHTYNASKNERMSKTIMMDKLNRYMF